MGQEHHNSAGKKMSSDKGKDVVVVLPPSSAAHEQKDRFEITLAQPMISTNPTHQPQLYGLFTAYGPNQSMGPVMLPMSLLTDDGTMYVNPKQYHGILRRRESRAKEALKAKPRPINKPYRHESRHRHAMRRPRGAGGRFLNSKELQTLKDSPTTTNKMSSTKNKMVTSPNDDNHDYNYNPRQFSSNPSVSSNSEVLQNPNPNPTGSEVTSNLLLYGRQFDWYQTKNSYTSAWEVPPPSDHGCCDFFLKV
ncbi:hypothetical protein V2J09_013544 [Rumex salicifolius]